MADDAGSDSCAGAAFRFLAAAGGLAGAEEDEDDEADDDEDDDDEAEEEADDDEADDDDDEAAPGAADRRGVPWTARTTALVRPPTVTNSIGWPSCVLEGPLPLPQR